jgi:pimeloyl-ACP methyl ester carboxylesterase
MGEQNVEEFGLTVSDPGGHLAALERDRDELAATTPAGLVKAWRTLLGPADLEVTTGSLAAYLLDAMLGGIEGGLDGWFDDDVAFVRGWGFELDAIAVPVLHWQGAQDKMVPFGHGRWLAQQIPNVESHLSEEDGHLTLIARRVPQVHDWLLERF